MSFIYLVINKDFSWFRIEPLRVFRKDPSPVGTLILLVHLKILNKYFPKFQLLFAFWGCQGYVCNINNTLIIYTCFFFLFIYHTSGPLRKREVMSLASFNCAVCSFFCLVIKQGAIRLQTRRKRSISCLRRPRFFQDCSALDIDRLHVLIIIILYNLCWDYLCLDLYIFQNIYIRNYPLTVAKGDCLLLTFLNFFFFLNITLKSITNI